MPLDIKGQSFRVFIYHSLLIKFCLKDSQKNLAAHILNGKAACLDRDRACTVNVYRYLYDAKWQSPFQSAKKITRVLEGKHKPIYHPMNDAGDHVVVINSRNIALLGREWQFRVYFHHPGMYQATNGGG